MSMTTDTITRMVKSQEQQALALHLIEERIRTLSVQMERIAKSLEVLAKEYCKRCQDGATTYTR